MILTLKIKCVWGLYLKEPCIRVIEMDERSSLVDLHNAIQDALGFDQDHLFNFFVANSASRAARRQWLTQAESWEGMCDDLEQTPLASIWPLDRKKFYYLFDFGDDWTFEIRKQRGTKEPEPGLSYPRVIQRVGADPEQYGDPGDY